MRTIRLRAAVAALVSVAALVPGSARADGDLARDVLQVADVSTPYPARRAAGVPRLKASVARVFAHGQRIKVAVIATPADLGTLPSYFGKPGDYAKFLGTELERSFIGPLLIAMPGGFGIWDGGRSTAAEEKVLATLEPPGPGVPALLAASTAAVDKLAAAGALRSKDILGPSVVPRVPFAHPGRTVLLTYGVLEDSERARDFVTVFAGMRRLASFTSPLRSAVYAKAHSVRWKVPDPAPAGLRFCVRAVDASGNRGRQTCLPIRVSP